MATSSDVLSPEGFWEAFRKGLVNHCTEEVLSSSRQWTDAVIDAAKTVCGQLGPDVRVQTEKPHRLDVSASRGGSPDLVIAFESELAPVGYKGRTHKGTWREEFVKLCEIPAELRILSTYFLFNTGAGFPEFLRQQLDSMRANFEEATPSKWLLVFGSENSRKDPDQPWLPFSLEPDFSLRPINTSQPLRPRRIARGIDPRE